MTGRHVAILRYRLVPRAGVSYKTDALPIERDLGAFRVRLESGVLTVTMRDHYGWVSDADAAVQPYLRAWRASDSLARHRPEFDFEYDGAEVVEPPDATGSIQMSATVVGKATITAETSVERGLYPEPPDGFALDPDAETLWNRWQGYLERREPLGSMAYFCLTVLELQRGRSGAASRFSVSANVLSTLGRLSTETGDPTTARKATPKLRPLTEEERVWLEAAVKALVRRAGEVAASSGPLPDLTMADLPQL